MIRIVRSPEPPALQNVRVRMLAAARSALNAGTKIPFAAYDVVKQDLATMQHLKCCYCEKREEQAKYRDVDHHRPKAPYWWLAWTWENLLFSCIDCNRDEKRDQYPLAAGATQLVAEQQAPGAEVPLLIDPSDPAFVPTKEIEFRREKINGKERWVPYGLTARGQKTVEVCGLGRAALLDLYAWHVVDIVRPKLADVFRAVENKDQPAVFQAWGTAKRGLLNPARPFAALSHDAMKTLVRADLRDEYRLTLEMPGS